MTGRVTIRHRVLDSGDVVPVIDRALVDRAEDAVTTYFAGLDGDLHAAWERDVAKAALKGALGPDLVIDHEEAPA